MDAEAEQSAREVMPLMPLVRVHENRTRRFSCTRAQAAVFAISFSSYASMHLGRKAYSAIKPMLGEQHVFVSTMPTDQIFGLMDASFLLLYSIGLFASGALADRHDLRVVISVGLVLSGLFTSLFGLGGLLGVEGAREGRPLAHHQAAAAVLRVLRVADDHAGHAFAATSNRMRASYCPCSSKPVASCFVVREPLVMVTGGALGFQPRSGDGMPPPGCSRAVMRRVPCCASHRIELSS